MHFPGCFTGIRESPQIHGLQLCQRLPNIIFMSSGTKSDIVLEFLISSNLHLQGTYFQLGTQHLKLQLSAALRDAGHRGESQQHRSLGTATTNCGTDECREIRSITAPRGACANQLIEMEPLSQVHTLPIQHERT